jgi:hypothetical protein
MLAHAAQQGIQKDAPRLNILGQTARPTGIGPRYLRQANLHEHRYQRPHRGLGDRASVPTVLASYGAI